MVAYILATGEDEKGVILKFNENYQRIYSTFWGGVNREYITDVSFQVSPIGNHHNVVMVGLTYSDNSTYPLNDIPGSLDYYDGNAITAPQQGDPASYGPTAFIGNLYNVSTPLRIMNTNLLISKPEQENSIEIIPNPVLNSFLVQSSFLKLDKIILFDIHGKQIYSTFECTENMKLIDTQNLNAGIYLLRITTENGKVSNLKLIKN